MTFDFYNLYKSYSNVDLLKIVKRPSEYQSSAVDAATLILKDREPTEEDILQAEMYIIEIDKKSKLKQEKINSYKEKATDFFEPVLNPSTEVKPAKWLNILLSIIALQYLWTLYINIRHISDAIKFVIDCKDYSFNSSSNEATSYWACFIYRFDIVLFLEMAMLVYVPIIFYLLLKRRQWGWILLFADTLFTLIMLVSQSYIFFKYQQIHQGNTLSYFMQVIIKALFTFFLWRNYISDFFGITYSTKRKTSITTIIIAVLIIVGIPLLV